MSFARVRLPDRIVAGGALALFVFLFFFDWYGGSIKGLPRGSQISGATVGATGWEAFTHSRWVWLLTVAIALGSVLAAAAAFKLDGPVQIGAVVFGMGTLASVLIAYRIIYHPGESASGNGLRITYGIESGIWLGLVAALAITLGGYLQLLAESGKRFPGRSADGADEPRQDVSQTEQVPQAEDESQTEPRLQTKAEPQTEVEPQTAFTGLTVARSEPASSPMPPERAD